jgi:hypothetical protein
MVMGNTWIIKRLINQRVHDRKRAKRREREMVMEEELAKHHNEHDEQESANAVAEEILAAREAEDNWAPVSRSQAADREQFGLSTHSTC